jgi:hypothetical protein
VPIGDKIELNLGPDPRVLFELVKRRVFRDQIWVQVQGTDTFKRVGGNDAEIEEQSSVAGWDEHTQYVQRIRNYTARPIEVEVRRSFDGHVVFRSGMEAVLHDYRTVQYMAQAPASTTVTLPYEVVVRQGRNAKQWNVTLEPAEQP